MTKKTTLLFLKQILIPIVALVALLAIIGIVFDRKNQINSQQNNNIPSPPEFITFRSEEIGIEFKYPKEWGGITLPIKKGGYSGEKFEGIFSNVWIEVGGTTKDFSEGRGKVFTDFDGYTSSELKKYEPYSIITISTGQQAILFVNKEINMMLSKLDRAVWINLPGPKFNGVAFRYVRPNEEESLKFDEMIKTITILNQ